MSNKKARRGARKTRSEGIAEIVSPAGRWILLPGGGFGLQQPLGKTPA